MSNQTILPPTAEKAVYVKDLFDNLAGGYDRVNDWMTGGLHHAWKRRLLNTVAPKAGDVVLDLATGTGDLAIQLLQRLGPNGRVTGLDFSAGMLGVARARADGAGVDWLEGDMLALPFADASFDVVTVGFGLRNVTNVDLALAEIVRVLRPGGRFGSLETGRPRTAVMRGVVAVHLKFLPLLGKLLAGKGKPYEYLHASMDAFLTQDELATKLRAAGLLDVRVADIQGGALAIVSGHR